MQTKRICTHMRHKNQMGRKCPKTLFKPSGDAEKKALVPAEKKPVLDRWMEQVREGVRISAIR